MRNSARLLALVAPGAIAVGATMTPWMVPGSSATPPRMATAVPGKNPVRAAGFGLPTLPAGLYFSTKARSIT